jgi:hypothetical protein
MDVMLPSSRMTVPRRREAMIAKRWLEWMPPLAVWLNWHPTITGAALERDHREWMLDLLDMGVPMQQVRRLALDDPRQPRLMLLARAQLYLEKSKRRKPNAHKP